MARGSDPGGGLAARTVDMNVQVAVRCRCLVPVEASVGAAPAVATDEARREVEVRLTAWCSVMHARSPAVYSCVHACPCGLFCGRGGNTIQIKSTARVHARCTQVRDPRGVAKTFTYDRAYGPGALSTLCLCV